MKAGTQMGLASYFFTKNVDRTWRLMENLEAGMIGMNVGKCGYSVEDIKVKHHL
jgi:succinate-semialdehyde dehydrogenase/glutarate-semialdehyde dehydrogenase